jgi:hypothetical protein
MTKDPQMTGKNPPASAQTASPQPAETRAGPDDLRRKGPDKKPADQPADDSLEGEGSPGLSITGGGGHA